MLGLRVESSPLLASEWALSEQIGINAKLFLCSWGLASVTYERSRTLMVVLVGRMGTVWGRSSGGFAESGPLPVGYKGSVCEESDSAPFSLILSHREDIKSTDCQCAGGSSFNVTPSSHSLVYTVTPDLFLLALVTGAFV